MTAKSQALQAMSFRWEGPSVGRSIKAGLLWKSVKIWAGVGADRPSPSEEEGLLPGRLR